MVNLVFVILIKGFSSTQRNYEQEVKVQSKRDIDYNLSKEARVIKTKYTIWTKSMHGLLLDSLQEITSRVCQAQTIRYHQVWTVAGCRVCSLACCPIKLACSIGNSNRLLDAGYLNYFVLSLAHAIECFVENQVLTEIWRGAFFSWFNHYIILHIESSHWHLKTLCKLAKY